MKRWSEPVTSRKVASGTSASTQSFTCLKFYLHGCSFFLPLQHKSLHQSSVSSSSARRASEASSSTCPALPAARRPVCSTHRTDSVHDLGTTHICMATCTTTTLSNTCGLGKKQGSKSSLKPLHGWDASGSAEVTGSFCQNSNELGKVRLPLQWGCLQTFPEDYISSSQVRRGSDAAQLVFQAQDRFWG